TSGEKRVFLVILFTSFSGSLVSRIPGAVQERRALTMARDLIVNARQFKNMDSVIQSAKVK
ncbi:hypothetical protein, partial [Escherichia coli]|uniref:hypothetical protein n=1 Tax=Escherichia coli TaxID=562 RepID=UPI00117A9815